MAMQLSTTFPSFGRRGLLAASAIALFASATFGAIRLTTPDNSDTVQNLVVEMHTTRVPVRDLAELTKKSDAVISGHVIAQGATKFIEISGGPAHALQPDPGLANLPANKKAGLKDAAPAGTRSNAGLITPPAGIPVTQFTVEVSQVLNGKINKGQHVIINQMGGTYQLALGAGLPTLSRTLVSEHDPLLVKGEEQVFFLSKGSDSGTFDIAGGPDGRFKVDARGLLQPVDDGSPVGQAHKGETVDSLAKKVNIQRLGGQGQ
jgi:hypothetical protein